MPKLSHSFETELRRTIRDAFALDPLMTQKKLLEVLENKYKHTFDHRYIARLTKKVSIEATPNLDKEKIENRLKKVRETMRLGQENLLKLAHGQGPGGRGVSVKDMIAAWRAIALLEKLQLDAELDLRIFDKGVQIEDREAFRARAIPQEIREAMLITARLWRLPADLTRKIEPREAEVVPTSQSSPPAPQGPTQANVEPNKANEPTKAKPPTILTGVRPDQELLLS